MIEKIEINVIELIEFKATFEDKKEIVKDLLFRLMTEKECNEVMVEILSDLKSTEQEFDKRGWLIATYDTLIESMEVSGD